MTMNSKDATMDETTTMKMANQRPRLVIELNDPEFNYQLKKLAVDQRKTVREVVLSALEASYGTELGDSIKKELRPRTLLESLADKD